MSTKINNGYILRHCTLAQALDRLKSIREECIRRAQQGVALRIAETSCFWADMDQNYIPIPRKEYAPPFWRVQDIIRAERLKVMGEGTRSSDWDFTLSVLVIPHGEHVLALKYQENNPGFTEVLTAAGFEDFHYQDSSDRPDGIAEADWNARCDVWDEAMPDGVPAHSGFNYELVSWYDIQSTQSDQELMANTKPSDQSRRMKVAMELIDPTPPENLEGLRIFERAELGIRIAKERAPHVFLADAF